MNRTVELELEEVDFMNDVLSGLKAENKWLPSKYFYDAKGDTLFQQIMHLDEYYLTKKELGIFESQKEAILKAIDDGNPFRIIELGAGDGSKTKVLLKYFQESQIEFTYTPVDISGHVLKILETNLLKEIPELKIESYTGDYFEALSEISSCEEKDVVFFLGSNVGNFVEDDAESFLSKLKSFLNPKDLLLMGVDMKKNPSAILSAYNDSEGVTKEFNLNLLDRINNEIGADFDRNNFQHYPYYNPQTGECCSYLISKIDQVVSVGGEPIYFKAWEAILMEVSKKYDPLQLDQLATACGFETAHFFTDENKWFANVVWEVKK